MPAPRDLTPADTSSYVTPSLAAALRGAPPAGGRDRHVASADRRRDRGDPWRAPRATTRSSSARSARRPARRRPTLVDALLATGRPVVTVALRTPWDLAAYPRPATHVCTYSILPESMAALAAALFGRTESASRAVPGATRRSRLAGRRPPSVTSAMIDLQVNGAGGHDLTEEPGARLGRRRDPAALRRDGVPADPRQPVVVDRRSRPRGARRRAAAPATRGATPLGWHVEGPFLAPTRAGAHDPATLLAPTVERRRRLVAGDRDPHGRRSRRSCPGALDVVAALVANGVVVSAGPQRRDVRRRRGAGFDAGIRSVTHLFNAMAPLDHREPGLPGAALADDRVTIGLIPDGLHVHPALVALVRRAVGPERLAVVTDAIAALGMRARASTGSPAGDVIVDETSCRLPDGDARRQRHRARRGGPRTSPRSPAARSRRPRLAATACPARLLGLGAGRSR